MEGKVQGCYLSWEMVRLMTPEEASIHFVPPLDWELWGEGDDGWRWHRAVHDYSSTLSDLVSDVTGLFKCVPALSRLQICLQPQTEVLDRWILEDGVMVSLNPLSDGVRC